MTRINRNILQQLLVLFGFFALVLVLIYWINRAVRLFDQLIADGQSAWVFVEFTALSLPAIISLILPIAAFAAAVYLTNRISADSELSILQATGHSGFRILQPYIVFGILVLLMQGVLQHYLLPKSTATLTIRQAETAQNATARLLTEGTFISAADGVTLYIESISPNGELLDVMLSDMPANGESTIYSSRRAFLVKSDTGPKLVLVDGIIQRQQDRGGQLAVTRFNDFVIDVSAYLEVTVPENIRISDQTTPELLTREDASDFDVRFEIADRLAKSVAALAAVMLGVSTLLAGSFSRFGIWQRVLYAVVLLILTKLLEGIVIDRMKEASGQLWLFSVPYLAAFAFVAQQMLLRDRPWLKARQTRVAS